MPNPFIALALLFVAESAAATSFTGLGSLLPGGQSWARAVSADGSVVVGESNGPQGVEAFRWDATSGMVGLGDLPGAGFGSRATGVSGDGSVIVGASSSALTGSLPFGGEGFVWDSVNGMTGIGTVAGISSSNLVEVSDDGLLAVGRVFKPDGTSASAVKWDAVNGFGLLAPIGSGGVASGLSADGSIIVGSSSSVNPTSGNPAAFIWDAVDGMSGLGSLATTGGVWSSRGLDVSADGQFVVGNSTNDSGQQEAFIWDAVNGMSGLGLIGSLSSASGVSANGEVIVGRVDGSGSQAVIWTADDGIQVLSSLLTSQGIDLAGWQLEAATGISDDGRTIVGYGTHNSPSSREAWVVRLSQVPEPSTGLLAVAAWLAWLCSTRALRSGGKLRRRRL